MKKILFLITSIIVSNTIMSQEVGTRIFLRDANGLDIRSKSASIENASYLFHPDYLKASLYTKAGKLKSDAKYKLILQENRLFYMEADGADMEVVSPIYRIEFEMPNGSITVFEKGFDVIDNLNQNNFYQVLSDGKAKLLMDTKFATETKMVYGTGAVTTTDKLINYYGSIGSKITKVSKEENLLALMEDKSAEMAAFIKKEKTKFKRQADLEKLFNYYNQLVK
ncbi:hypothetical protein [Sediminibacterium sp.]|uniref:hypothetical protein n=1 Tax=Sediminibacterium sp. TaxID=1917865 RepID=UPI0026D0FBD7|nr:hypothetical protein [Sediminibacterium sp.]MDP3393298.1 hypothetical protein [Sediminibacterium sp.]MDP3567900.1 hypothetical protein [Sediminibacterium sp.]